MSGHPPSTLFAAQEARLAGLDALARRLWLGTLTHSQGILEPRLTALADLQAELLAGTVSDGSNWRWPPQPLAGHLAETMSEVGLAGFCQGQDSLTETVLMSLLFHLDFIVDYRDRGASEEEAMRDALAAFAGEWRERVGQLEELVQVFGLLPDGDKHLRWDTLCGHLRGEGWQEVLRIRRLLEGMPELAELIRKLGRSEVEDVVADDARETVETLAEALAVRDTRETVRIPDMPGRTCGIHRSDRLARMLPSEAALLGHPTLRLIWHARRAERTLLTYEEDDRLEEIRHHQERVPQPTPQPAPRQRPVCGPILVCVDTSGSMQGGAGEVAKATVLEAVRTAHAQHRPCHLFAFGGAGEVIELEVPVTPDGIARLIDFLGQGFGGGTDICGPIEKALARLEDARWQQADLLLASDGEFGATQDVAIRLDEVKAKLGLRVQGILIGDRETIGLLELADDVFWVRDWRRFGASANPSASPVHSKSLTAMYFPGALRSAETRAATVDGVAASVAVRAGLHRNERR